MFWDVLMKNLLHFARRSARLHYLCGGMSKLTDFFIEQGFKALSRLPFGVLYALSDVCFPLVYYVGRYRRGVVRTNLANSFPEKSVAELNSIERDFYRRFCDYAVETVKLISIGEADIRRRMEFVGLDEVEAQLDSHPFVFLYLGHVFNWEWVSTIPMWTKREATHGAQLYRPLNNAAFDRLFKHLRTRFGAENISKYDAFRRIMRLKAEGVPTIIGFISDQAPRVQNIHDWTTFLNQDTPVFTGTERIGKKVDAAIYYVDMERVKRGYYRATFRLMSDDVRSVPDYELTNRYMQLLEQTIRRQPAGWLWSHRRWKHKRQLETQI